MSNDKPTPFDLAEELRTVLRWEGKRMGAVSAGVMRQVIAALDKAPVAIMDTRDGLGVCALAEEDFPALYALKGCRVALIDMGPNVKTQGQADGEAG